MHLRYIESVALFSRCIGRSVTPERKKEKTDWLPLPVDARHVKRFASPADSTDSPARECSHLEYLFWLNGALFQANTRRSIWSSSNDYTTQRQCLTWRDAWSYRTLWHEIVSRLLCQTDSWNIFNALKRPERDIINHCGEKRAAAWDLYLGFGHNVTDG